MRRFILPITALLLLFGSLNSCMDEAVIIEEIPTASVDWEFWAGARNVEIDGEITNEGNTFVNAVELEIQLFDEDRNYISSVFLEFTVNLEPNRITTFFVDVRERHMHNVDVRINRIW